MINKIIQGLWLLIEKILRWCISPYLRAFLLRLLGAKIGVNVRVYEVKFFNLRCGFKNLIIEDDVHIGTDALIDLSEKVVIKRGATISPRVTLLTHINPGSFHHHPLCKIYPPRSMPIEIGRYSWLGTLSIIMPGVKIGEKAAIGANSLVNSDIPPNSLSFGIPAKVIKENILNAGEE